MTDISPKLLEQIKDSFESKYKKSSIIANLQEKIDSGSATYSEVNEFAIEVGELLAKVFQENLSEAVLPDGKMYFNIAKAVVEPMMKNNYDIVSRVAGEVQTALNASSKIGIKAIEPDLNQDRIDGIINRLSSEEHFDEIKWILYEPVVNFTQSIVDDAIKANAEFQYEAGLTPKIIRTIAGNCCAWCRSLAGNYSYPDVPRNVYRRHNYCRCKVDYVVGKHHKNVHNNNTGKRRYEKDKYGNYVLTKDARVEHAKQMEATEKIRKEQARQKRIDTWNKKKEEQFYKPIEKGKSTKILDRRLGIINTHELNGYDRVYLAEGTEIKRRALHTINSNVNEAIEAYGGDVKNRPQIVLIDTNNLGALGKYDAVNNVMYLSPDIGDAKLLSKYSADDSSIIMKSTEYHECWHWMQAQSFSGVITEETWATEYMPLLKERCKKNIEKFGITEYNVGEISAYAKNRYIRGRYDEVEAEYVVKTMLKRR